jgi:NADPH:quinone reductase-like Zn-dependent oxidoreductase
MKAIIYNTYGAPEVLNPTTLEKPLPKENEILIKIHAATVTSGDVRLRSSDFPPLFWLPTRLIFGLFRPKKKILGHELAGTIEAIGIKVTKFKVGDLVFGTTTMLNTGSYAEYICLPEEWKHGVVTLKPKNLNFTEAAALPVGAMTAMFLLKKAKIAQGMQVLIYGASGSVGSYAVQLAKHNGAGVTAVCSSTNFAMVRSLGADSVIDYRTEDYTEKEGKYDIVFDAVGKTSKSKTKKILTSQGAFVSIKMLTKESNEHLRRIKELAENGSIKPFIDRVYKLNEIVEAHTYVDLGRKKGNVVIDILA